MIYDDMRSLGDVKKRIGMKKTAFWKCKELLTREGNINLRKRMLDCYVKSVVSYGCEIWTQNNKIQNKIDAFQLLCYRKILKIKSCHQQMSERINWNGRKLVGIFGREKAQVRTPHHERKQWWISAAGIRINAQGSDSSIWDREYFLLGK